MSHYTNPVFPLFFPQYNTCIYQVRSRSLASIALQDLSSVYPRAQLLSVAGLDEGGLIMHSEAAHVSRLVWGHVNRRIDNYWLACFSESRQRS